ncbi:MAG: hypothetical protein NVS3B3_14220 [Aquirhabdus sp.]
MSLQLGANFPSRWLSAEKEVRQQFLRDLNNVCVLLDPKTDFDEWQSDQLADPDHYVPPTTPSIANATVSHDETSVKSALPVKTLIELEQRLLKQADQVIERALDPIRAELKAWIQEQIRQEIQAMEKQG